MTAYQPRRRVFEISGDGDLVQVPDPVARFAQLERWQVRLARNGRGLQESEKRDIGEHDPAPGFSERKHRNRVLFSSLKRAY